MAVMSCDPEIGTGDPSWAHHLINSKAVDVFGLQAANKSPVIRAMIRRARMKEERFFIILKSLYLQKF